MTDITRNDPRRDPKSEQYDENFARQRGDDPRNDPMSPKYDPAYAEANPRVIVPPVVTLSDLNAFKLEMNTKFEALSADIEHLRQHGGGVDHHNAMQKKLSDIRAKLHSFGN